MSGHSKWSKIKRKKGALDNKRSNMFSRVVKEIMVAVKEGGSNDPELNSRLRLAIANAKGINMPKDNIQRAISKAEKDNVNIQEITFEGYGVGGLAVFIECLSDNNMRTVANIRSIFNKRNGSMGTNGSLSFLFERKGVFTIHKDKGYLPDFELELIDGGLDEMEDDGDYWILYTPLEEFGNMQKKLEELKIEVENAELKRIPNNYKQVDVDTAKQFLGMIDAFEDDDDVQRVYHNLEMTDELESALSD